MGNKFKDIDIKNHIYYFFDDLINVNNLDRNKNKIVEMSYKNTLIYHAGHVTIKNLRYIDTKKLIV